LEAALLLSRRFNLIICILSFILAVFMGFEFFLTVYAEEKEPTPKLECELCNDEGFTSTEMNTDLKLTCNFCDASSVDLSPPPPANIPDNPPWYPDSDVPPYTPPRGFNEIFDEKFGANRGKIYQPDIPGGYGLGTCFNSAAEWGGSPCGKGIPQMKLEEPAILR
jgi:hypothetical protein